MKNLDALNETDQDTLAKLAAGVAAGVISAATAKILYKKYKEKKILNKYIGTSQEQEKKHRNEDMLPDVILTGIDVKKYG